MFQFDIAEMRKSLNPFVSACLPLPFVHNLPTDKPKSERAKRDPVIDYKVSRLVYGAQRILKIKLLDDVVTAIKPILSGESYDNLGNTEISNIRFIARTSKTPPDGVTPLDDSSVKSQLRASGITPDRSFN